MENLTTLWDLSNKFIELDSDMPFYCPTVSEDFCRWMQDEGYLINGISPLQFNEENANMDTIGTLSFALEFDNSVVGKKEDTISILKSA